MPFTVDIAGKEVLTLNAIVEVLKCVEEKEECDGSTFDDVYQNHER